MSAPLVINLKDGSVWERRAVTASGMALYALAGSCKCPEYLMASESELAAQGIAGTADVLPVPVGPEQPVDGDRAKAPWGRGEDGRPLLPMGAHWTDVPELVDKTVAGIQARVNAAQSGHWYVASDTETWRPPGTVRTRVDGYGRTVGQFTNLLPSDLELVLHAHDDLSWLLEMVAKFRARVAELEAERLPVGRERIALQARYERVLNSFSVAPEAAAEAVAAVRDHEAEWLLRDAQRLQDRVTVLEAERHSTNESLDEATSALRLQRDRFAELEQGPALPWAHAMSDDDLHGFLGDLVSAAMGRWQSEPEVPDRDVLAAVEKACAGWRTPGQGHRSDEPEADGIARRIVPVQVLREDEPLIVDADGSEPTPLRWGLNDVQWGDDDSVVVMLSGPDLEPYWLKLDAERAAVLRADLAGPEGAEAGEGS